MNEKSSHSPQVLKKFMKKSRQYLAAPTIERARRQQLMRRGHALPLVDPSPDANYRRWLQGTALTFSLRQRFR